MRIQGADGQVTFSFSWMRWHSSWTAQWCTSCPWTWSSARSTATWWTKLSANFGSEQPAPDGWWACSQVHHVKHGVVPAIKPWKMEVEDPGQWEAQVSFGDWKASNSKNYAKSSLATRFWRSLWSWWWSWRSKVALERWSTLPNHQNLTCHPSFVYQLWRFCCNCRGQPWFVSIRDSSAPRVPSQRTWWRSTCMVWIRCYNNTKQGLRFRLLKDESGCFRTSKLKEYPPAMCRALACSFSEALQECHVCAEDMPEEFLAICKELEISSYGDTFGPDFAGWRWSQPFSGPVLNSYCLAAAIPASTRKEEKKMFLLYRHDVSV